MTTFKLLACLTILVIFNTSTVAQIKVSVECNATGTSASGERLSKHFVERFQIESGMRTITRKDGSTIEVGVSNAELLTNGAKQKPELIAATTEYAVIANAVTVGTGFGRRLLVFTYILDLKAMQLTRVMNSLPASVDERTYATCQQK